MGGKTTPLVCYHAPFPSRPIRVVWQHIMHRELHICYVGVRRLHPDRADPVCLLVELYHTFSSCVGSLLLDLHCVIVFFDMIVTVQSA